MAGDAAHSACLRRREDRSSVGRSPSTRAARRSRRTSCTSSRSRSHAVRDASPGRGRRSRWSSAGAPARPERAGRCRCAALVTTSMRSRRARVLRRGARARWHSRSQRARDAETTAPWASVLTTFLLHRTGLFTPELTPPPKCRPRSAGRLAVIFQASPRPRHGRQAATLILRGCMRPR